MIKTTNSLQQIALNLAITYHQTQDKNILLDYISAVWKYNDVAGDGYQLSVNP